jgi:2-furoyl-CoA dehydrogenase 2Fe-2S iron sulfur subunit
MTTHPIRLTVNGVHYDRKVEPRVHLADFLRHDLDLTGTHVGCEHGVCGACTIIVDNRAVRSCLMLAVQADGSNILTVEGLAGEGGALNPLQEAFREHHALQCGFCTPGFLMTLTYLLQHTENPTEDVIREELSGNLCRCTGYSGIVKAALAVAASRQARKVP